MYKWKSFAFATNQLTNFRRHEKGKHKENKLKQTFIANNVYSNNSRSQEKVMHNEGEMKETYIDITLSTLNQDSKYDVRLNKNF